MDEEVLEHIMSSTDLMELMVYTELSAMDNMMLKQKSLDWRTLSKKQHRLIYESWKKNREIDYNDFFWDIF